jgi:hypothetical protein
MARTIGISHRFLILSNEQNIFNCTLEHPLKDTSHTDTKASTRNLEKADLTYIIIMFINFVEN